MTQGITPAEAANLAAEFDRGDVHWRAQTVLERDGKHKALALAYLDARNVMERLDEVCGPQNWQDRYEETPKGRIICTLSICIDGHWVNKSDGAGDTDVEGDKGAVSDALKRAAVKWGIGRYLYSLPNVWAPCEIGGNGKFKKFSDDPWNHVPGARKAPKPDPVPARTATGKLPPDVQDLLDDVRDRDTQIALRNLWEAKGEDMSKGPHGAVVKDAFAKRRAAIDLMDGVN